MATIILRSKAKFELKFDMAAWNLERLAVPHIKQSIPTTRRWTDQATQAWIFNGGTPHDRLDDDLKEVVRLLTGVRTQVFLHDVRTSAASITLHEGGKAPADVTTEFEVGVHPPTKRVVQPVAPVAPPPPPQPQPKRAASKPSAKLETVPDGEHELTVLGMWQTKSSPEWRFALEGYGRAKPPMLGDDSLIGGWFKARAEEIDKRIPPLNVTDAWATLGVPHFVATEEEITKAFRAKQRTYHPDAGGRGLVNASDFQKALTDARKWLTDPAMDLARRKLQASYKFAMKMGKRPSHQFLRAKLEHHEDRSALRCGVMKCVVKDGRVVEVKSFEPLIRDGKVLTVNVQSGGKIENEWKEVKS